MIDTDARYTIKLSFETVELPPFKDILILAKNAPHGRNGLSRALDVLAPDTFEIIEVRDALVDSVFVNKRILARIPQEKIIAVLAKKVFPFVVERELLKVDFKVDVMSNTIEYEA